MEKRINDEFMQQIATEQAWKELSGNFAWTETLLEKYCDKVDWEEISGNTNILWTIPMLQKFSKKVDWKRLSGQVYGSVEWFTEAHLEAFKDKWDWVLLSNNISIITEKTIDKFIDNWDWDALIDGSHFLKIMRMLSVSSTSTKSAFKCQKFKIRCYGKALLSKPLSK